MALARIGPSGASATGRWSSPCKPASDIPTLLGCEPSDHMDNRPSLQAQVMAGAVERSRLGQRQMLLRIIVSYCLPSLETHLRLFNHRNLSQSHVYFNCSNCNVLNLRVIQVQTTARSRFRLCVLRAG